MTNQILGHCERCHCDKFFVRAQQADGNLEEETTLECPTCEVRYFSDELPAPKNTRLPREPTKKLKEMRFC